VIHVRGIHHLAAVATLAHTCDAPVLVQDHGSRIPTGWRASAWRWALRGVSGVTFTTRAQAEPFVHAGLLSPDTPVFEVLEGSSTFTPGDRAAARRATGMVGDPCLLWTGRLDDNKDPLTALAAVEIAAAELPELHLWMCYGKAPLLDAVRTRIDASPMLRERVTLLGTRPHEELEQRHRAADFYVQASHREAGGFSLLEAMACGTPPIVTDIPAARRITGDVGARVPVGDAAAFAQAIARLAREERDGRRAATRARFDSALSYDVVARELTVAYEALASVPA
jgi:glycosyltransferase involved in cell wall biosynthesis